MWSFRLQETYAVQDFIVPAQLHAHSDHGPPQAFQTFSIPGTVTVIMPTQTALPAASTTPHRIMPAADKAVLLGKKAPDALLNDSTLLMLKDNPMPGSNLCCDLVGGRCMMTDGFACDYNMLDLANSGGRATQ
jgi:hypothetical protein